MPDQLEERELAAIDDALAGRAVPADLAELGELARALRDDRPAISDSFAATLDARMRRGFPDPGPRRRAWWHALLTPVPLAATATVLLIAVVVASVPGGGGDPGSGGGVAGGGGASGVEAAPEIDRADRGPDASASSVDSAAGAAEPLPPSSLPPAPAQGRPRSDGRDRRQVERSASLILATRPRDVDEVSARVQEVTRRQGGFVASSTVSSANGGSFVLRIPTRNLDAALAELSRLGNVRERSQRSDDITAQAVSARSRLADARTERESLLEQLGAATTLQETAEIRERLEIVSRQIEQARAGMRRVRNRAAFSTVAVELVADRDAGGGAGEDDGAWTPGDAARDALRLLEVAAGVALIALALGLPLLLLALLAAWTARWSRRRRREHALDVL